MAGARLLPVASLVALFTRVGGRGQRVGTTGVVSDRGNVRGCYRVAIGSAGLDDRADSGRRVTGRNRRLYVDRGGCGGGCGRRGCGLDRTDVGTELPLSQVQRDQKIGVVAGDTFGES